MLRRILKRAIRILFTLLTNIEAMGLGNIPDSGGFILCSNHLSIIDSPLLFIIIDRDDVSGFVAKKHRKNPLFRILVNIVDGIWLNRDEADTQAIRAARDYLKSGDGLGIAPEGTRSPTAALISPKTGAAYLASLTTVPIVPVAITGTETVIEKLKKFRRPQLTVRIGIPFNLPSVDRRERDILLDRYTDEIMCHIAAMLPAEYRGVYTDHPRLRELLS